MQQYNQLVEHILSQGETRQDRTGVGTVGVFGHQMRFDLTHGFPAITTKRLAWKACVAELLWFIEGSGNERRLAEIQHGTRDTAKRTIWTDNAEHTSGSLFHPAYPGDLGRIYGVQWRRWKTTDGREIDQLNELINGIKSNPYSRRHILTAWNPGELDQMALPPCHMMCQFYVSQRGLSCHLYQRSADVPLGVPFNIASYSLLTHMIAHVCNLPVADFVHTIGDAHIYLNQVELIKEQLARPEHALPTLWLNPDVRSIDQFGLEDIKLINYTSEPPIVFPFAV